MTRGGGGDNVNQIGFILNQLVCLFLIQWQSSFFFKYSYEVNPESRRNRMGFGKRGGGVEFIKFEQKRLYFFEPTNFQLDSKVNLVVKFFRDFVVLIVTFSYKISKNIIPSFICVLGFY